MSTPTDRPPEPLTGRASARPVRPPGRITTSRPAGLPGKGHAPRRGRSAAVLVAVAALLAVAACGGGPRGAATDDAGRTTLVWNMWSGSNAEVATWEAVGDLVSVARPDLAVQFETTGFNDYWTKLAAQASGGDTACILGVQSLRARTFAPALAPLNDVLADAGIDAADFDPTIWAALQVDGAQLAVPYDYGPQLMYLNLDRFRAAGVAVPTPDWTVDDFLAAATALTDDDGYGFALYPMIDHVIPWSLVLTGTAPVRDDGELALTTPEFAAAMQWYTELATVRGVSPPVSATSDVTAALNSFTSGSAAMVVDGPWQLLNLVASTDFEVGVLPMPAGPGGSRSQVAGSGFGISRDCPEPEKALAALAVLTGPDAAALLAEEGRAFPARVAQQEVWFRPELASIAEGLSTAIERGEPLPAGQNWTRLSQLFSQYGVPTVNGQQTVPEFLALLDRQNR